MVLEPCSADPGAMPRGDSTAPVNPSALRASGQTLATLFGLLRKR